MHGKMLTIYFNQKSDQTQMKITKKLLLMGLVLGRKNLLCWIPCFNFSSVWL